MIKSFADKRTAAIFVGLAVRSLPMRVQRHARTKLLIIEAATRLDDLRISPGNRLEALKGSARGNTVFASTNSGAFVSFGETVKLGMSRSLITIEEAK